jgi:hypothetical protein
MSIKADIESLFVYQHLFGEIQPVDDKCHDFVKMKHTASVVNVLFKISSVIPGISLITLAITLYKKSKVSEMDEKQFKGGREEKHRLYQMLDLYACSQLFGLGILGLGLVYACTNLSENQFTFIPTRKLDIIAPLEMKPL